MIELTHQGLLTIMDAFSLPSLGYWIITKQDLRNIYLGSNVHGLKNVIVGDIDSLKLKDNIDTTSLLSVGDGITIDEGNYITLRESLSGLHYVIYVMEENYYDCTGLLGNAADLVSVDYVGNYIKSLDFPSVYDELTEINLANNDTIPGNIYEHLEIDNDGVYVYNGVYNKISFSVGTFAGSNITKIVFPDVSGAYTIPANCCANCSKLEEVVIPDCVTAIGANAFQNCPSLRFVHIGNNVATIDNGAFDGCTCSDMYFDVNNTNFYGEHGCLLRKIGNGYFNVIHATKTFIEDYDVTNYETSYYNINMLYKNRIFEITNIMTNAPYPLNPGAWIYIPDGQDIKQGDTRVDVIDGNGNTQKVILITADNIDYYWGRQSVPNGAKIYYCAYQLVQDFENNVCVGDKSITKVQFYKDSGKSRVVGDITKHVDYIWYNIQALGDNVFKGCTNITEVRFPLNYNKQNQRLESIPLGSGTFEGCTSIVTITSGRPFEFMGNKTFFGCTSLTTLLIDGINIVADNTSLWFGNTPNLSTIAYLDAEYIPSSTSNYPSPGFAYIGTQALNAIVMKNSNNKYYLAVGCKTTDCQSVLNLLQTLSGDGLVGDYAFYGSNMLSYLNLNSYSYVGNSSFYGCSGITECYIDKVINIGSSAFFGCTGITTYSSTSIQTIGSKAFANSGLTSVSLPSIVSSIAEDAFDGCNLVSFTATAGPVLASSTENVENSYIKGSTAMSLVKSASGKKIVNSTDYDSEVNKPITAIKNGAFNGVNLNAGDSTNIIIHIPHTVNEVGSNIFTNSKLNNSPNQTGMLSIDYEAMSTQTSCIVCDSANQSFGLLFYLGGKYFKNLVNNTYNNKLNNLTHYEVIRINQQQSGYNGILLQEVSGGGQTPVLKIYYSSNGILMDILALPSPSYDTADSATHVDVLPKPQTIQLMYYAQVLTPAEETVYCDSDLTPGTTWLSLDSNIWAGRQIPSDLERRSYYLPKKLTGASGAFSNAKWISMVASNKSINGIKNAFNGCTNLGSVTGYQPIAGTVDYNPFEGTISEGMFSGCESIRAQFITPTSNGRQVTYPAVYEAKSFEKSSIGNVVNIFTYGTTFGKESFADTEVTRVDFISPLVIDKEAFKNCAIDVAAANNTCGVYFTGEDGATVMDKAKKVVIGTKNTILTGYLGVNPYAFYGRKYTSGPAWQVSLNGSKTNFVIGESAFSESSVSGFVDTDGQSSASYTTIGKSAFKNCKSLNYVAINDTHVTLSESAFEGCTNLQNLTIPSNIDIPTSAFSGCTSISAITIGGAIGANAFNGCSSLITLNLSYTSTSNKTINNTAFIGCPIRTLTYGNVDDTTNYYFTETGIYVKADTNYDMELLLGTNNFEWPIVPDDETDSRIQKFRALRIIGKHAFNGRGLSGVVNIPGGVTKIDDYAFANNPAITAVNIPPTVEYIGAHAFDGCTNIEYAVIPDSCTFIGEAVFKGCALTNGLNCNSKEGRYHLTEASYQRSTLNRDNDGNVATHYNGTLDLTNFDGFDRIGDEAFSGTSIKVIKLGKHCSSIGAGAFRDCLALTELHINSSNLDLYDECLYGCANLCDIYIHDICKIITSSQNEDNTWYNVGAYVKDANKKLHLKQNQPTSSKFIQYLIDEGGFKCVYDA